MKSVLEKSANILYFYSDQCEPCKALRPKIKEMIAENFPKANLFFIDSEVNMDIAIHFNVFSSPTLICFFDGKEFIRRSKYVSVSELQKEIERYYTLLFSSEENDS